MCVAAGGRYGTHPTGRGGVRYRLGEAFVAGDIRRYRVAPTVGFALGKPPTSCRTRHTWPSR